MDRENMKRDRRKQSDWWVNICFVLVFYVENNYADFSNAFVSSNKIQIVGKSTFYIISGTAWFYMFLRAFLCLVVRFDVLAFRQLSLNSDSNLPCRSRKFEFNQTFSEIKTRRWNQIFLIFIQLKFYASPAWADYEFSAKSSPVFYAANIDRRLINHSNDIFASLLVLPVS